MEAKAQSGAVLDQADFPDALKVGEVIELVRAHFPDPVPTADLAERCGFSDGLDRYIGDISADETRWLAILLSLAGNPRGLFMDMPTLGMDVGWRRRFWRLIKGYTADGCLAVVSANVLHEVETFATRVLITHRGRLIANGSVEEIIAEHGESTLSMNAEWLPETENIRKVEWHDGGPVLQASDADAVVRDLTRQGVPFEQLEVRRPALEEVLLSLIPKDEL